MAETGSWTDPLPNYNFKIEIQGITEARFAQCSPPAARVQTMSYRQGGTQEVVHRIPGQVEYADVTLAWGLSTSRDLWLWFQSVLKGTVERKNVSIVHLASDGVTEKLRWNLGNAWPKEWRCAPLDARGVEVAIYSVTLTFETLEIA